MHSMCQDPLPTRRKLRWVLYGVCCDCMMYSVYTYGEPWSPEGAPKPWRPRHGARTAGPSTYILERPPGKPPRYGFAPNTRSASAPNAQYTSS